MEGVELAKPQGTKVKKKKIKKIEKKFKKMSYITGRLWLSTIPFHNVVERFIFFCHFSHDVDGTHHQLVDVSVP